MAHNTYAYESRTHAALKHTQCTATANKQIHKHKSNMDPQVYAKAVTKYYHRCTAVYTYTGTHANAHIVF